MIAEYDEGQSVADARIFIKSLQKYGRSVQIVIFPVFSVGNELTVLDFAGKLFQEFSLEMRGRALQHLDLRTKGAIVFDNDVLDTDIFTVVEDKRLYTPVKIERVPLKIYGDIFFILNQQSDVDSVIPFVALAATGIQRAIQMRTILQIYVHVGIRYVFAIALHVL
jgi:hypothetical protein